MHPVHVWILVIVTEPGWGLVSSVTGYLGNCMSVGVYVIHRFILLFIMLFVVSYSIYSVYLKNNVDEKK